MRLGGPVLNNYNSPEEWIRDIKNSGYRAAYCPVEATQSDATLHAYEMAARDADIVIAEVGAWSNPLSPDPLQASEALKHNIVQLSLADRIGARCCVNIPGSRGEIWDGPHPKNLTSETFDRIVETVRSIIDAVKPTRTFYTLETMPWMYPDSPCSYLQLLKAIDRPNFAVHMDPANLINCPSLYYSSGALIKEFCEKLGPYIKSCHAKDVKLYSTMTTKIEEVIIGEGGMDYRTFLMEVNNLDDCPLMLEHLSTVEQYNTAASEVRKVAEDLKLTL